MKRVMAGVILLALAASSVGCGRAIDEGVGLGFGAKANVVVIQQLPRAAYGPVTVGSITSSMDPVVPGSMLAALGTQARTRLAGERDLAGGRAIKVSGVVVHFEGAGLMDQAFGPQNEVVVRVTVTDATSGQTLGAANILGRARGSTSASEGDLSDAFAKGLVKWLKKAGRG